MQTPNNLSEADGNAVAQLERWASRSMRISIIGNSGSGKSTLARMLASSNGTALLDLDTLVLEPNKIAIPRDPKRGFADLE